MSPSTIVTAAFILAFSTITTSAVDAVKKATTTMLVDDEITTVTTNHLRRDLSQQSSSLVEIKGICPGKTPTELATVGDSCGIPDFVDPDIFGDNMDTNGVMKVRPKKNGGLKININLKNLPTSDLVLTAWIIWVPFGVEEPPVFKIANHASPLASTRAGFTTGFGRDANEFRYTKRTRNGKSMNSATLQADLNFNPTMANQGPLTRETYCFQKDVPGIQDTAQRHYPTPDGTFIPTSSSYLRMYDPHTGFEILEKNGDPKIVKSPVSSLGIEVIAHVDNTTHGLSQGIGGVDHYFILFFPFEGPIEL